MDNRDVLEADDNMRQKFLSSYLASNLVMALSAFVLALLFVYGINSFSRPLLRNNMARFNRPLSVLKPKPSFSSIQRGICAGCRINRGYSTVSKESDGEKLGPASENLKSAVSVSHRLKQLVNQHLDNDLDDEITKNYYTVVQTGTHTLDLGGAFIGNDIVRVLAQIKKAVFYDKIEHLILSRNQFENVFVSDSAALPDWPPNLKILDLSQNLLSGSHFPWEQLPPKLEVLHLQGNLLKGEIKWGLLPYRLEKLWVFGNQFEGTIQWNLLPGTLKSLGVSYKMGEESDWDLHPDWTKDQFHRSDPIKTFLVRKDMPQQSVFTHGSSDPLRNMKIALFLFAMTFLAVPLVIYGSQKSWAEKYAQK